jgi:hypothetical protein
MVVVEAGRCFPYGIIARFPCPNVTALFGPFSTKSNWIGRSKRGLPTPQALGASIRHNLSGLNGEADWIVMDPEIDFGAIFSRFDTLLIGRKTFAAMQAMGGNAGVIPVLLGGGIPLLPTPAPRTTLALRSQRVYEKSGIVGLEYKVLRSR